MQDLPLNALRAFAMVHALGGVRAAARELGVAHSSVSRHLAELERWLGVRLIDASAGQRGIVFTAQGEALGRAAFAGLQELERAIGSVRESRSSQTVILATTHSFAVRWLLPRLHRLAQAHPGVELSVVVDQAIVDPAVAGVDVAIRMGRGPWPGVRCEAWMDDALYPVASPDLHASLGFPARPHDLLGAPLLHDRDPEAAWESWRSAFGPPTLDAASGPRYTSSDLVLRAAAQGKGVALARHRLVREDIDSGALIRLAGASSVSLAAAYWLILPSRGKPRAATGAVVAWLRHEAAADGPASSLSTGPLLAPGAGKHRP